MPTRAEGGALSTFTTLVTTIQTEKINGPSADAYRTLLGHNKTTYLISPGVYDCAILTVYYPRTGFRLMAHYNPFSGPRQTKLNEVFEGWRNWFALDSLVVSINFNSNAQRPYAPRLFDLVDPLLPEVSTIAFYSYGGFSGPQGREKKISIYLAPDGRLFGSAP